MESNRKIELVDTDDAIYQNCLRSKIVLDGVMTTPIVIKFISSNRDNTRYVFEYKSEIREVVYENEYKYAAAGNVYLSVMKHVDEIFENLEIVLSKDDRQIILKALSRAISKCESRYGMPVKNFDEFGCDALVTIEAIDNGKPKHKVLIYNHCWEESEKCDWESIFKNSRSIYGDNFVTWLIDKDSITFEDLIERLMGEFENPYLIIEPSLEKTIILDFKLNLDY